MIAEGAPAPDFEAPDQDGRPFRLSGLRGSPVVLYFYPEADTPGCTRESQAFQALLPEFARRGVKVVGVSVDDCPKQKAFAQKYGLRFPLVADSKKAVVALFGVQNPRGAARRVSFFLDPAGTVVEVVDTSTAETHVERARARFLASS